jgi:hypothetical protein
MSKLTGRRCPVGALAEAGGGHLPSCPVATTTQTGGLPAARVTGAIPAMKVAVWVSVSPMRMRKVSAELPMLPMWMLSRPVVTLAPAKSPMAMLPLPVVLLMRALTLSFANIPSASQVIGPAALTRRCS